MPQTDSSTEPFSTADLFDSAPDRYLQLDLAFRHFGGVDRFSGACSTIVAGSDPATIRQAVDEPGDRRVLVIDGRTWPDRACLGDLLAARAAANRWAGVVIIGAVRDTAALAEVSLGVVALRTTAKRPFGDEPGKRDVTLQYGECRITPGDMVFVDRDAVLVLPRQES